MEETWHEVEAQRQAAPVPEQPAEPVLVVDLDQSLSRSDTLYETVLQIAAREPWRAWRLLFAARRGSAPFKAAAAARLVPDPAGLLFNDEVLDEIERARQAGRSVVLVSGAAQAVVDAVAAHLGIFDAAFGSNQAHNLTGRHKAEFVRGRYGDGGYDYIGDSHIDVAVWQHARRAITVGARAPLRRKVEALGGEVLHLAPPMVGLVRVRAYMQALRPHRWVKNLLVALPMLAAQTFDWPTVGNTAIAFLAFCLFASGAYVVNDLLDLADDRAHPRRRLRAFASGRLSILHGLVMAPVLLIAAGALCLLAGLPLLLLVLLGHVVLTMLYALVLQRGLMIGIVARAVLDALRVAAGVAATGVVLSPRLLAFLLFFLPSLAALRRQGELAQGRGSVPLGARISASAGGDLPVVTTMAVAAGYLAVLVVALFVASPAAAQHFAAPEVLWGLCLVLLYWISRMALLAQRGRLDDDPLVVAARDPASLACAAGFALIALAATIF